MIRTVTIPRLLSNRIGQLQMSAGCIQYQDPNTGLWISDPGSPACGAGSGGDQLPADPGGADAVAIWAAASNAAANEAALNASTRPASLVLAQSLMSGNIPSPLPGLGVTIPDPMKKYLLYGALAVAILYIAGNHK